MSTSALPTAPPPAANKPPPTVIKLDTETPDRDAVEADTDDLMKLDVNYGKLQFIMKNVLHRIGNLEKPPAAGGDGKDKTAELEEQLKALSNKVDGLAKRAERSAAPAADGAAPPAGGDYATNPDLRDVEAESKDRDDELAKKIKALNDKIDALAADGNHKSRDIAAPVVAPHDGARDVAAELDALKATVDNVMKPMELKTARDVIDAQKKLDALQATVDNVMRPTDLKTARDLQDAQKQVDGLQATVDNVLRPTDLKTARDLQDALKQLEKNAKDIADLKKQLESGAPAAASRDIKPVEAPASSGDADALKKQLDALQATVDNVMKPMELKTARDVIDAQKKLDALQATVDNVMRPTDLKTARDVQDAQKQLDALQATVDNVMKPTELKTARDVIDAQKQLNALQATVDNVMKPMDNKNARDIMDIKKQLEGAAQDKKDLEDLKKRVAELDAVVPPMKDDIEKLKAKVTAHDGMISMLTPSTGGNAEDGQKMLGFASTVAGALEDIGKLKNALEALERRVGAAEGTLKKHDDAIADNGLALKDMKEAFGKRIGAAEDTGKAQGVQLSDHAQKIADLEKAIADLKNRLAAAEAGAKDRPAAAASSEPSAGLKDMQKLRQDLEGLQAKVKELEAGMVQRKEETKALGQEATQLAQRCQKLQDEKANRDELGDGAGVAVPTMQKASAGPRETGAGTSAETEAKLKALRGDVDMVKARLDDMSRMQDRGLPAAPAATTATPLEGTVENKIAQLAADALKDRDWAQGQIVEIRAVIEHIHHSKADAAQVANKAERDYVENALEKLMREVEQVLNSTNAGLIDTLDKSLGILRDMIDGKASKTDVAKIKAAGAGADGSDASVPDGLTGFRSYRCLGCNRTVEAMRPRPMGANFATFMNRLPAGQQASNGVPTPQPPGTSSGTRQVTGGNVAATVPAIANH